MGVANLFFTVVLATIAALYLWARMTRSLPDLKGWHVQKPESEFRAADAADGYSLDDYQRQEDRVFEELNSYIAQILVDAIDGRLQPIQSAVRLQSGNYC